MNSDGFYEDSVATMTTSDVPTTTTTMQPTYNNFRVVFGSKRQECTECGLVCFSSSALSTHLKYAHGVQMKEHSPKALEPQYKCNVCSFICSSRSNFNEHFAIKHGASYSDNIRPSETTRIPNRPRPVKQIYVIRNKRKPVTVKSEDIESLPVLQTIDIDSMALPVESKDDQLLPIERNHHQSKTVTPAESRVIARSSRISNGPINAARITLHPSQFHKSTHVCKRVKTTDSNTIIRRSQRERHSAPGHKCPCCGPEDGDRNDVDNTNESEDTDNDDPTVEDVEWTEPTPEHETQISRDNNRKSANNSSTKKQVLPCAFKRADPILIPKTVIDQATEFEPINVMEPPPLQESPLVKKRKRPQQSGSKPRKGAEPWRMAMLGARECSYKMGQVDEPTAPDPRDNKWPCPLCIKRFANQPKLRQHLAFHARAMNNV